MRHALLLALLAVSACSTQAQGNPVPHPDAVPSGNAGAGSGEELVSSVTAASPALSLAAKKNLPLPGVEYVPTPGTTAKAVVAYRDACVHFVELLLIHDAGDWPTIEDVDENGVDTGELAGLAAARATRAAIK